MAKRIDWTHEEREKLATETVRLFKVSGETAATSTALANLINQAQTLVLSPGRQRKLRWVSDDQQLRELILTGLGQKTAKTHTATSSTFQRFQAAMYSLWREFGQDTFIEFLTGVSASARIATESETQQSPPAPESTVEEVTTTAQKQPDSERMTVLVCGLEKFRHGSVESYVQQYAKVRFWQNTDTRLTLGTKMQSASAVVVVHTAPNAAFCVEEAGKQSIPVYEANATVNGVCGVIIDLVARRNVRT